MTAGARCCKGGGFRALARSHDNVAVASWQQGEGVFIYPWWQRRSTWTAAGCWGLGVAGEACSQAACRRGVWRSRTHWMHQAGQICLHPCRPPPTHTRPPTSSTSKVFQTCVLTTAPMRRHNEGESGWYGAGGGGVAAFITGGPHGMALAACLAALCVCWWKMGKWKQCTGQPHGAGGRAQPTSGNAVGSQACSAFHWSGNITCCGAVMLLVVLNCISRENLGRRCGNSKRGAGRERRGGGICGNVPWVAWGQGQPGALSGRCCPNRRALMPTS